MDLASVATQLSGGASIIIVVVVYGMLLSTLGIIGYLGYLYTRYNIKFRLLVLTKDRVLEFDDKLRKIAKKGKPIKWKLLKRKNLAVPPPPTEAFRITTKGKLSLTAFLTEDGIIKYVTEEVKDVLAELASTDLITTEDKSFHEQNYEEAKKWEHRDWTQVVTMVIPYIIVFLIFVVFLAFWGKTVAPTLDLTSTLVKAAEALESACAGSTQIISV